jgi:hypothetical protein
VQELLEFPMHHLHQVVILLLLVLLLLLVVVEEPVIKVLAQRVARVVVQQEVMTVLGQVVALALELLDKVTQVVLQQHFKQFQVQEAVAQAV